MSCGNSSKLNDSQTHQLDPLQLQLLLPLLEVPRHHVVSAPPMEVPLVTSDRLGWIWSKHKCIATWPLFVQHTGLLTLALPCSLVVVKLSTSCRIPHAHPRAFFLYNLGAGPPPLPLIYHDHGFHFGLSLSERKVGRYLPCESKQSRELGVGVGYCETDSCGLTYTATFQSACCRRRPFRSEDRAFLPIFLENCLRVLSGC